MLENNDYTRSDFYKFSRKARYFLPDNFKRIFYVQKIRSKLYKHSKEMGANITLFFLFFQVLRFVAQSSYHGRDSPDENNPLTRRLTRVFEPEQGKGLTHKFNDLNARRVVEVEIATRRSLHRVVERLFFNSVTLGFNYCPRNYPRLIHLFPPWK